MDKIKKSSKKISLSKFKMKILFAKNAFMQKNANIMQKKLWAKKN